MKKNLLPLFCLFFVAPSFRAHTQTKQDGKLFLTLKQIQSNEWGVYVIPEGSLYPTINTTAGTGQVTIIAPAGFTYYDFKNLGGMWVENARVTSPKEAIAKTYISFGFVMNSPKVNLSHGQDQILFSFKTDEIYNGTFSLFENGTDPFEAPNSWGTNPGNDLGMIDKNADKKLLYYTYSGNIIDPNTGNPKALLVSKKETED